MCGKNVKNFLLWNIGLGITPASTGKIVVAYAYLSQLEYQLHIYGKNFLYLILLLDYTMDNRHAREKII